MAGFARSAGLLFTGLFAGFLTAVLVLELSLRRFDGTVYTQVRLVELDHLDDLAAATLLPALAATAVLVLLNRRAATRWPVVVAFALLVLVFGLTLTVNLPINADQSQWTATTPPAGWAGVRDRWQVAHVVRTVAGVLAFALLVLARPATPTHRRSCGAPPHRYRGNPQDRDADLQRPSRIG
jgi:hypothetical protein